MGANVCMERKKFTNKGETLLELIISIAIFALVISSSTLMFGIANNIEADSFDAAEREDERFAEVVNYDYENPGDTEAFESKEGKVTVKYKDNNKTVKEINITYIQDANGAFERVIEKK